MSFSVQANDEHTWVRPNSGYCLVQNNKSNALKPMDLHKDTPTPVSSERSQFENASNDSCVLPADVWKGQNCGDSQGTQRLPEVRGEGGMKRGSPEDSGSDSVLGNSTRMGTRTRPLSGRKNVQHNAEH